MHRRWIGFAVAAVAILASAVAWPHLPARVATHWNAAGEVDGYSPRWLAATMMPAMIVAFAGLARLLPKIDPRFVNYRRFIGTYWLIINGILVFIGAVHLVLLANGVGWHVPVGKLVPVGIGLLFMLLGNYLSRVQPNWFMGIRTPWTLSSDQVWRKTHRIGGRLFVLGGIALAGVAFLPPALFVPALISVIVLVGVVPVVLSYFLWRKEQGDDVA